MTDPSDHVNLTVHCIDEYTQRHVTDSNPVSTRKCPSKSCYRSTILDMEAGTPKNDDRQRHCASLIRCQHDGHKQKEMQFPDFGKGEKKERVKPPPGKRMLR